MNCLMLNQLWTHTWTCHKCSNIVINSPVSSLKMSPKCGIFIYMEVSNKYDVFVILFENNNLDYELIRVFLLLLYACVKPW